MPYAILYPDLWLVRQMLYTSHNQFSTFLLNIKNFNMREFLLKSNVACETQCLSLANPGTVRDHKKTKKKCILTS
jgi:hypothetical protein